MGVRGVVPHARQVTGRPVEHDSPAHEQQPLDVALDRAELVGDVEDRDAQLAVEAVEKLRECLLGLDVDARRGLVEDEYRGFGGKRLRDEGPLLLSARQPGERAVGDSSEANAGDRLLDRAPMRSTERAD
jgi:hypothetical protein